MGMGDDTGLLYLGGSGDAAGGGVPSLAGSRFSHAHRKEALWVLSNLLGGSPAHAAAVLASPASDTTLAVLGAAVGPGFGASFARLPLPVAHVTAYHLLHSPWPVRVEAAMCAANLAKQVRVSAAAAAAPELRSQCTPPLLVRLRLLSVLG